MKIQLSNRRAAQGSVLLICLLITFVIGTTLASFLILTQTQNLSVYRSQSWNNSISVTEAGVEEAMTHLNNVDSIDNLASNGWTDQGGKVYACPRRYIGSNYYDVKITVPADNKPVIDSAGTVVFTSPVASAAQPVFAAVGTTTMTQTPLARKVQVKTRIDGLLTVVMAAQRTIDFSGNNVATDSFDSEDPNYSTGGIYDPNKSKDHGDVCTNYTITNSLSLGNANIKGTVRTGPTGTAAIGANGSVGDAAWVNAGTHGIQTGHFYDDFNVSFPPVKLPALSYSTPPVYNGAPINGVHYDYILGDGNWQLSELKGALLVRGKAVLYVTTTLALSGSKDEIRLDKDYNSSLKLYVAAPTASIGGNGVVNESNVAVNFQYLGLPANTALGFQANASFTGAIYCPQAAFTLGGGGNNTYDFVGASVSYTVKMNGKFKFHYDEALMRNGPGRGYLATSWKEL